MKLKDIYKLALNRINAKEGDKQVEGVVMSGINAAIKLIATQSKKSKSVTVTVAKNIPFTLPDDFLSLSMLLTTAGMKLSDNDFYLDSNFILISDTELVGGLTMLYNYIPVDMVLATDGDKQPDVKAIYHSALAAYGAYMFHTIAGSGAATMFLNEFNAITQLEKPQVQQAKK